MPRADPDYPITLEHGHELVLMRPELLVHKFQGGLRGNEFTMADQLAQIVMGP
ncbi:MAG: hypothetical protein QM796_02750 [Chthoniobacteraceae bacterium]